MPTEDCNHKGKLQLPLSISIITISIQTAYGQKFLNLGFIFRVQELHFLTLWQAKCCARKIKPSNWRPVV